MHLSILLAAFVTIVFHSCSQAPSQSDAPSETTSIEATLQRSGLTINNEQIRGTNHTDSAGTLFSLRSIPITLTNDTTIPIHLHFSLDRSYAFNDSSDEFFRAFPLPEKWALEGTPDSIITQNMKELPLHIQSPELHITIAPGEQAKMALGTLYPNPAELYSVVPDTLFIMQEKEFSSCFWPKAEEAAGENEMALGLKVRFINGCRIIPCGYISYSE